MERTLGSFINALRNAEVRISTAETLDAVETVRLVGYRDREFLKNSLALTLPKTWDEKNTFDDCFDRFFTVAALRELDGDAGDDNQANPDPRSGEGKGEGEREGEGQGGGESEGGGGGADEGAADDPLLTGIELPTPTSQLGQMLMDGDRSALTAAMIRAGQQVGVESISVFTQRGLFTRRIMDAMGNPDLQNEIVSRRRGAAPDRQLAGELNRRREVLRERVRDHVEQQFLLHADVDGNRLREEMLRTIKLSNVEQRNFRHIKELVRRMAKRLVTMHSRRRRVFKRGQLNVAKTLRHNMAYDGNIFDIRWKSRKIDRPKVMAICDVSGSVANYVRFMLLFLYSLEEVIPRVRAFAFSSDLGEVTDLFQRNDADTAIARTLHNYGNGSTDYGQAWLDFRKLALDDVDNRTTIIVLGDGRNNHGDPRTEVMKMIFERCRRLVWLNPEPAGTWGSGDSEMRRYRAYAHQVDECNSLKHMERAISNLLRTAT